MDNSPRRYQIPFSQSPTAAKGFFFLQNLDFGSRIVMKEVHITQSGSINETISIFKIESEQSITDNVTKTVKDSKGPRENDKKKFEGEEANDTGVNKDAGDILSEKQLSQGISSIEDWKDDPLILYKGEGIGISVSAGSITISGYVTIEIQEI